MIAYKKGDLFSVSSGIIAHGCNCIGGFGSGVAGQIALKYPLAKSSYLKKHKNEGWSLGDVQVVKVSKDLYIINCATQRAYLPRNIVHADYEAIKMCFEKIYNLAKNQNLEVSIPKIGAGLANGNWQIIEGIINSIFKDYPVTVFTLD